MIHHPTHAGVFDSVLCKLRSSAFWHRLNPQLHIEELLGPEGEYRFDPGEREELQDHLFSEGYGRLSGVMPPEHVDARREAIERIRQIGLPPVFAFVYDEFWSMFAWFADIWSDVLGPEFQQLPDFWVWYLDPVTEEAGWGPHRDRNEASVDGEGRPESLTVWISLTDVSPLNGCIYVVPMQHDPGPLGVDGVNMHDIRALPAPAGSVLFWNQWIVHWGGRASKHATVPRISVAMEFQRGDIPPFRSGVRPAGVMPTFAQRLHLIGRQILQYSHFTDLPGGMETIATDLLQTMTVDDAAEPLQTLDKNSLDI